MKWQTKWTAVQKAACDFTTDSLFVVGLDSAGGRYEHIGRMEKSRASFLFVFAGCLHTGSTPEEAYEKTVQHFKDHAAKVAAKAEAIAS